MDSIKNFINKYGSEPQEVTKNYSKGINSTKDNYYSNYLYFREYLKTGYTYEYTRIA